MPKPATPKGWNPRMENLEERLAMSANPLAPGLGALETHSAIQDGPPPLNHHVQSAPDFWLDGSHSGVFADHDDQIERTLQEAHNQTGLTEVRNDYGFTGGGQTVAVIDSGIAWDHFALGGGFGSNYRVVGGWDFTENDGDPYDDGPEGSHGTHVAGIVGGDSGVDNGVAPDVDLVGLRVFDDAGNGYFSWVEDALQWVHDNRNAFENPITAVNLSLGAVGWNSESIPAWANLENEFAQLEADGIFVSVSAGNSFTDFNETGLSYPAASPYVVPVMSVDDSGNLSYFSQRSTRGIAAPGRWITSTVPDYVGNNNGITDDYATFSGTSMAAPYVAGASVIIREAMEFVGYANITQDVIYNHMKATAESFYDSATGEWFDRLDLDAAIDALMPTDEFGSTMGTAFDLGTISGDTSTSGLIGSLSDADYFSFTAGSTGTVTFTASTTHDLEASWDSSATGWTSNGGTTYTLEVAAGNTYTIGLSSSDGLGYYDLDITAESTFTFTDWGATALQATQTGLNVAGTQWYRVTAGQGGFLTADVLAGAEAITVELYDANLNLLQQGGAADRVDVAAAAGQEFFLRLDGSASNVDLRLTNAVEVSGNTLAVTGTSGVDSLSFSSGVASHTVDVNGVVYSVDAAAIDSISILGGGGQDTLTLSGSTLAETIVLDGDTVLMTRTGLTLGGAGFSSIEVTSGSADDVAYLLDSAGNDTLRSYANTTVLISASHTNRASGFETVIAVASRGGYDSALMYDSSGDDSFISTPNEATLSGTGFHNHAQGFDFVQAHAVHGGHDEATLHDSSGNDYFSAGEGGATLSGVGFFTEARGFEATTAHADQGGFDQAFLYDSAGNDSFRSYPSTSVMVGAGFSNRATGFDSVLGYAVKGGQDTALLYGSSGDDLLVATPQESTISGLDYSNSARGFDHVIANAMSGAADTAVLTDSAGDDLFEAGTGGATLSGQGFRNELRGFDSVTATAGAGGQDQAFLYDSTGNDSLRSYSTSTVLLGSNFSNRATGFASVTALSMNGGNDTALMYDSAGNDNLVSDPYETTLSGAGFANSVRGFGQVLIQAIYGGVDQATLLGSEGDDVLEAGSGGAAMSGQGYRNEIRGFDSLLADASQGGDDLAFLFDSDGDDVLNLLAEGATLLGDGFSNTAEGFDEVRAYSLRGGSDSANLSATDYLFSLHGAWS